MSSRSASAPSSDSTDSVNVIPLDARRDSANRWLLTVPPLNAADRPIAHMKALRADGSVNLNDDAITNICRAAVSPADILTTPITRHRVENGWLYTLTVRVFTTMINVAYTNDRTLEDATYDADPTSDASASTAQIPLPSSAGTEAVLRYSGDESTLLSAADRNAMLVLKDNPQNVGDRLVERPITLVVTRRDGDPKLGNGLELTAVDGNSRLASAFNRLEVLPPSALPARFSEKGRRTALTPSTLMAMSSTERRKFTRDAAKLLTAQEQVTASSGAAQTRRDDFVRALNSMTAPAEIIVGFTDDTASHGQERFDSAVRALLMRMNVSVTPFKEGSRNAVIAEEVVGALYEASYLDEDDRDVLIGRSRVTAAMEGLKLDPTLPDLRAAVVTRELTYHLKDRNKIVRDRLGQPSLYIRHRQGLVAELALRGYSAKLRAEASVNGSSSVDQVRKAFASGPLWPELLTNDWVVKNVNSDAAIDELAASALSDGEDAHEDGLLLGVLGLYAMTTTGYLLAPGGSAEATAGGPIDRGPIGSIVRGMLEHQWGVELLADAVKRARAGLALRLWDDDGSLVEASSRAVFNATLRRQLRSGSEADVPETPDNQQKSAVDQLCTDVAAVRDDMQLLAALRKEHGLQDRLAYADVEATLKTLTDVKDALLSISMSSPDSMFS